MWPPPSHFPFTLQPTSLWFLPPPFWSTLLFPEALRSIHQRWQFHPSTERGTRLEFFFYLPGHSFSGSSWDSVNPKLNLQVLVILHALSRLKFLSHLMGSWVFCLKWLLMCAALQIGLSWTQVSLAGRLSYLSHNVRPPSFEIPYTGINIRYLFFSFWLTSQCI